MEYDLKTIINVDANQRLLDSFCDVAGIAAAIIDLEGEILVGSRWQKICTDFHRADERTCKRCIESDTRLAKEAGRGKKFSVYQCKNGLTDAASPIIIDGEHVANAFLGQFLPAEPDKAFFRRQAKTYGFDEKEYLYALSAVPIVSEDRLPVILNFLATFSEIAAKTAIDYLNQLAAEKRLTRQAKEMLEISTPAIEVWDSVVVVPLIGTLDSQRTQVFMERLLNKIVDTNSTVALVDITGVPAVDTQTAQYLIEAVTAAGLLGTKVILTGIKPSIAQTLVHLGVDLSDIETRSSLFAGIQSAFRILNVKIGDGSAEGSG